MSLRIRRNYVILCGRRLGILKATDKLHPATTATLNMKALSTHWVEGREQNAIAEWTVLVPGH